MAIQTQINHNGLVSFYRDKIWDFQKRNAIEWLFATKTFFSCKNTFNIHNHSCYKLLIVYNFKY